MKAKANDRGKCCFYNISNSKTVHTNKIHREETTHKLEGQRHNDDTDYVYRYAFTNFYISRCPVGVVVGVLSEPLEVCLKNKTMLMIF